MTTTKCPGCGALTFAGDRVRHIGPCALRRPVKMPRRTAADALTTEPDPALAAAIAADFANHDKE